MHALLHLSLDPLPAEEIAETLGLARSNVSTALKELQSWKLIRVDRRLGDRRDHFSAVEDVFEIAQLVIDGRRTREFLPTLAAVAAVRELAENDGETPPEIAERAMRAIETALHSNELQQFEYDLVIYNGIFSSSPE